MESFVSCLWDCNLTIGMYGLIQVPIKGSVTLVSIVPDLVKIFVWNRWTEGNSIYYETLQNPT